VTETYIFGRANIVSPEEECHNSNKNAVYDFCIGVGC